MTKRSNASHEQRVALATLERRKQAADERAECLYAFIREYIRAKGYAPQRREIRQTVRGIDSRNIGGLLQILERSGRVQLHPWSRGITLVDCETTPESAVSFGVEPAVHSPAPELVPRSTKKCYDCDEPAVAGKSRCELHLARLCEAVKRHQEKKTHPPRLNTV
jgi:hypothetical protein